MAYCEAHHTDLTLKKKDSKLPVDPTWIEDTNLRVYHLDWQTEVTVSLSLPYKGFLIPPAKSPSWQHTGWRPCLLTAYSASDQWHFCSFILSWSMLHRVAGAYSCTGTGDTHLQLTLTPKDTSNFKSIEGFSPFFCSNIHHIIVLSSVLGVLLYIWALFSLRFTTGGKIQH